MKSDLRKIVLLLVITICLIWVFQFFIFPLTTYYVSAGIFRYLPSVILTFSLLIAVVSFLNHKDTRRRTTFEILQTTYQMKLDTTTRNLPKHWRDMKMFRRINSLTLNRMLSGVINGRWTFVAEADIDFGNPLAGSGHARCTIIGSDLGFQIPGWVIITSHNKYSTLRLPGGYAVDLESNQFNDTFSVFSNDPLLVFRTFDPALMHQLLTLQEKRINEKISPTRGIPRVEINNQQFLTFYYGDLFGYDPVKELQEIDYILGQIEKNFKSEKVSNDYRLLGVRDVARGETTEKIMKKIVDIGIQVKNT